MKPGIFITSFFILPDRKRKLRGLDSFLSRDFENVIASNCYLFLNFTGNKYCSVCSLHVITTKCYILLHVVFLGPFSPFLIFCGNFIDVKFSREFFVFEKQFGGFMTKPLPSEDRYRTEEHKCSDHFDSGNTRKTGNFPRFCVWIDKIIIQLIETDWKNSNCKDYTQSYVSWNF